MQQRPPVQTPLVHSWPEEHTEPGAAFGVQVAPLQYAVEMQLLSLLASLWL